MALNYCTTGTACVSAHCLGWGRANGDGDGRRRRRKRRLASPRKEAIPRGQGRASLEFELVQKGLFRFGTSGLISAPTRTSKSRAVENQFAGEWEFGFSSLILAQGGQGVVRFGYHVSSILAPTSRVENRFVRKGHFRFGFSSLNLAPTRAVEYQLAAKGLFRCGHPHLVSASLNQIGVDLDGREIAEREIAGRESAVRVSQQEKGRKEKDVVKLPDFVDYISSPSNAYVKHLVRLRQNPKTRSTTESVLVVGTVPLREICESIVTVDRNGPLLVVDVLLVREDAESPDALAKVSRRIVRVSADAMSRLSGLDSPPEVAAVLPFPPTFIAVEQCLNSTPAQVSMRQWCGSPRRILVLDSIQDPGNLGTLLRTAAAFAWDGVFLLNGCCDPFNDKALRASRGASFRVPIGIGEWEHVREFAVANELKLLAGEPKPLEKGLSARSSFISRSDVENEFKVSVEGGQGLCLVLGSEGQGLSEHVTRDCVPIGIPMPGNFESLNVAVAGGILMFLLR